MKYIRDHDRMHVLFLPQWYPNQINPDEGSYIRKYSLAAAEYTNISVLHVYPENKEQHVKYRLDISKGDGIFTVNVYIKKVNTRFHLLANHLKKHRYKKAHQIGLNKIKEYYRDPDLIHVHGLSKLNSLIWIHRILKNTPYIISVHSLSYLSILQKNKAKHKRKIYRHILKNSKEVLVHGKELQTAMLRSQLTKHVIDISKFEESQTVLGEKLFEIYSRSIKTHTLD